MARLLGANLGPIRIDVVDPLAGATTDVFWPNGTAEPGDELHIAAAGAAAERAFGFDTRLAEGPWGDEACIVTILDGMFPDDAYRQASYRANADAEIERLFNRSNVRATIEVVAGVLTRTGAIDGRQAEAVIDQYLRSGKADA